MLDHVMDCLNATSSIRELASVNSLIMVAVEEMLTTFCLREAAREDVVVSGLTASCMGPQPLRQNLGCNIQ